MIWRYANNLLSLEADARRIQLNAAIFTDKKFSFSAIHDNHAAIYFCTLVPYGRPPDKSAYWKIMFFISHPKHMLWVLKITVSMTPKHMFK